MARGIVDEILGESPALAADKALVKQLRGSRQVFSLSGDLGRLSDDTWEMLAGLEVTLCHRLDGVVHAWGEGIYDRLLRLRWPQKRR
jgi:hypothetical protein